MAFGGAPSRRSARPPIGRVSNDGGDGIRLDRRIGRVEATVILLVGVTGFPIVLRAFFLEGASYRLVVPQYWPMAVIGLVSLTLAAWLFRRRMY